MSQVAAPGGRLSFAQMEIDRNSHLAGGHNSARSRFIVRGGSSLLHHLDRANENIKAVAIKSTATGAKSGDNPAPVGITAGQSTLPERRQSNTAGRFNR